MNRIMQPVFIGLGIITTALTIGFYFQMEWATGLWMWPDGRLTYIFIASIMAAIAAPVFWMGFTREWGAATGGAINLLIQAGGSTLFLLQLSSLNQQPNLVLYAAAFGAFTLGNVVIFLWSRRHPVQDMRPVPRPVYYSFIVFVIVLVAVAIALLLRLPVVFPWPLKPETSVIIGWVFAGTAFYFSFPFLRSGWSNAQGQLLGFLAYDIILIIPFIDHFRTVLPEHRLSLMIYTGVLVYSGLLAIYYLFIHKPTRLWLGKPG